MTEKEWAKVVGGHGHIEAIFGYNLLEGVSHSSVMDKHIQAVLSLINIGRETPHRVQRAQVQLLHHHVVVPGLPSQFIYRNTKNNFEVNSSANVLEILFAQSGFN